MFDWLTVLGTLKSTWCLLRRYCSLSFTIAPIASHLRLPKVYLSTLYPLHTYIKNSLFFITFLVNLFGKENLFHIEREEMYHMNSNVFSIAPDVVVSEKNFTRLNNWLRENGFTVEEIPYAEIAKQEGLLRCSTLPLIRD